jgi:hypothetical protein
MPNYNPLRFTHEIFIRLELSSTSHYAYFRKFKLYFDPRPTSKVVIRDRPIDLIIIIEYFMNNINYLVSTFLYFPVTSSLLGPNMLLSTLLKHSQSVFFP